MGGTVGAGIGLLAVAAILGVLPPMGAIELSETSNGRPSLGRSKLMTILNDVQECTSYTANLVKTIYGRELTFGDIKTCFDIDTFTEDRHQKEEALEVVKDALTYPGGNLLMNLRKSIRCFCKNGSVK